MLKAKEILDATRDFLDENDWKYDYEAEKNLIVTGGAIHNHLKSVKVFISARDGLLQTFTVPGVNADPKECDEILKFINWANWNMISGNFELDVTDGEIRFRNTMRLGEIEKLPADVIEAMIFIPIMSFEKYGDSIAPLCFGLSDAVTEIRKIIEKEKNEEK